MGENSSMNMLSVCATDPTNPQEPIPFVTLTWALYLSSQHSMSLVLGPCHGINVGTEA